jgi:6-phosphogluconate dehydrogenase
MVGGKEEGIKIAEPILTALAVKDGYVYTGQPGTGHFVKLVHNGIEFGMLQSIGEGVELLRKSGFELDLAAIFKNWSNGARRHQQGNSNTCHITINYGAIQI